MNPQTLPHSEELFRLMVENVREYAIFLLDPRGHVASWNGGAERIKGYSSREIIGKHFSVFYPPEDIAAGKPAQELEIAVKEGTYSEEGWRLRKDGTRFWAFVVLTALFDEGRNLKGFAKVTRDMTDKLQIQASLEKQVQDRTQELQESNRELEQFAAIASHDLQEPLRTVSMYADLLLSRAKDKLNDEEKEFLKYATDGAVRAQQLIKDLLDYARATASKKEFAEADFNFILQKAVSNLQRAIEETGAEITSDPLPRAQADGVQMAQVFQNLLSNAIKYRGKEPPKIHVSFQAGGEECIFSVRDNGIGVPPESREKIFGLFQRAHRDKKYPGTGIGLAICKKIIKSHGGRLWVESEEGKGSAFFFSLPKSCH